MSEGTFRIRRQRPFTQIDNKMISDKRLSIQGLMKIIIRLDEQGKGRWSGNEIGLCDKSHY